MISNYEFIKTQAFELSWAVFRCTELFSQDKLRREVEAAAVDLIADPDIFAETLESEFPRIEKLTSLIRLAESIGQVASVNANVLYRELDNLAKAIRMEVVDRREKKNITASLERMFTNSAYTKDLKSEFGKSDSSTPQSTAPLGMTSAADNSAIQFSNIESLLSAATRSSQPISAPVIPAPTSVIPVKAGIQSSSGPAVSTSAPIRQIQVASTVRSASSVQGSWQHVILQKVKDLGQTTTKELTASFPEISERTIRFYLQKLVDNGAIDRVGSTGPGAAYKAKI